MKLLRGVGVARAKYLLSTVWRFLTFATMKEINLGISAEDTRQTGGDRLFPLDILTHTKSGRIRIMDAQLIFEAFEMMGSGSSVTGGNIMVSEPLTVASGSVTVTPAAGFVADTVSLTDEDNDPIYSYTENANGTDVEDLSAYEGTQVRVYYETTIAAATVYSLHNNDEPVYFELVHTSRYRDPNDSLVKLFQTRMKRCRLLGNFETNFVHGEFSSPVIEAELLDPDNVDRVVVEYSFANEPTLAT